MLIRDRGFRKLVIWLLVASFAAAFIFLPGFDPLATLPEILVFIVFLEILCAIQPAPQRLVCALCHFEILPRSPPAF